MEHTANSRRINPNLARACRARRQVGIMSEMSKCYTAQPTLPSYAHFLFLAGLHAREGGGSMKILTMIDCFIGFEGVIFGGLCVLFIVTVNFNFSN